MGVEYKLRFGFSDAESLTEVLRPLPTVRAVARAYIDFEFRKPENTLSMPDASAHVEEDGLYFCDYGGMGREFLGLIVARLVEKFGPVPVTHLE